MALVVVVEEIAANKRNWIPGSLIIRKDGTFRVAWCGNYFTKQSAWILQFRITCVNTKFTAGLLWCSVEFSWPILLSLLLLLLFLLLLFCWASIIKCRHVLNKTFFCIQVLKTGDIALWIHSSNLTLS